LSLLLSEAPSAARLVIVVLAAVASIVIF